MKKTQLLDFAQVGIFIQSLVATLGSLYFSTFGDPFWNISQGTPFPFGEGFPPCELCWFARILMYPIAIISYVGLVKKDRGVVDYILPLSVLGILLEVYQYGLQKLPLIFSAKCGAGPSCGTIYVQYFDFITIPLLCLIAFIVITIFAGYIKYQTWRESRDEL